MMLISPLVLSALSSSSLVLVYFPQWPWFGLWSLGMTGSGETLRERNFFLVRFRMVGSGVCVEFPHMYYSLFILKTNYSATIFLYVNKLVLHINHYCGWCSYLIICANYLTDALTS